ncbi:hypothetical protein CLCR_02490 [Cladophialophora carrionii]|uniref:BTB domain-containing protein n=1 Tax=Cladophialophora carrionii TaxID=86049 RepID=A0A1C1CET6_9EURO|nr:hypothetical protein CLCR_02490 [Cladophialophora carrionii]
MSSSSSTSHRLKRKADAMEDESLKQPRCIDVHSEGKVLVRIGKGDAARTIRVSGPLISHAAPSFGPLSSAPVEGGDRVITVENGSPEVYLDFFNIIHYKHANVGKLTGQRLGQLAELASNSWLFPVIHEITNASNDPTGMKSVIYTLKQHQVTFEELLDIAVLCEMDELFWRTSKVAVAEAPKPLNPRSSSVYYVQRSKLYGEINMARERAIVKFLFDVFEWIGERHPITPNGEYATEALTNYGKLHYLLRAEGIIAHKISNYEGSLGQAIGVLSRIIDPAKAKANSQDALSAGNGTIVDRQKGSGECLGRDIKGDLLRLIESHSQRLRGLALSVVGSEDFLSLDVGWWRDEAEISDID